MKEESETLHLGAVLGDSQMMLEALREGADPNERDDSGATALAQAIATITHMCLKYSSQTG